jgi:hypothetical protein
VGAHYARIEVQVFALDVQLGLSALIHTTGALLSVKEIGQKGLAHAWIADEDCAGSLLEEVEVQQSQDAVL